MIIKIGIVSIMTLFYSLFGYNFIVYFEDLVFTVTLIYVSYFILFSQKIASLSSLQYIRYESKLSILKDVIGKITLKLFVFITAITIVMILYSMYYYQPFTLFQVIKFYIFNFLNLIIVSLVYTLCKISYGNLISNLVFFGLLALDSVLSGFLNDMRQYSFISFPLMRDFTIENVVGYIVILTVVSLLFLKVQRQDIKI